MKENFYCLPFIYFWLSWVFIVVFFFAKAFSSYGEWGLLFIAVHKVLIAVASLVMEHRL